MYSHLVPASPESLPAVPVGTARTLISIPPSPPPTTISHFLLPQPSLPPLPPGDMGMAASSWKCNWLFWYSQHLIRTLLRKPCPDWQWPPAWSGRSPKSTPRPPGEHQPPASANAFGNNNTVVAILFSIVTKTRNLFCRRLLNNAISLAALPAALYACGTIKKSSPVSSAKCPSLLPLPPKYSESIDGWRFLK